MTIWNELLEMLKQCWQAFVDSGLAEDTADVFAEIISFGSEKLIWLMWQFINTIFPSGGAM